MTLKGWQQIFILLVITVTTQAIKRNGYINRPFGRHNIQVSKHAILTRDRLEKIKSTGLLFLNQQLVSSTRTIQWQYNIALRGIQGFFQVAEVQPSGYSAPQNSYISLISPNNVIFTMENAGIAIIARFFGHHALLPFGELPAQITGQITGVFLAVLTQFNLNSNGGLELNKEKPANCSALVKNAQFTLEPDGQYAWYVKSFEQAQIRHLEKSLAFANPLNELASEELVEPLYLHKIPEKFIVWNGIIISNQTNWRT